MAWIRIIHGYLEECQKRIKNPCTPVNRFAPKKNACHPLSKVKFNGNCIKLDSVSFLHNNVVNLYITYKLDT